MATVFDSIDDATVPLTGDGHVNVSPKGMNGTFAVLGPHRVG